MIKSFEDARSFPEGTEIDTDLCIIGSGAAGLTLARQFIGTNLRVCLLEAGGMSIDPDVDATSDVESIGKTYTVRTKRLRLFGGTTNHWGGHCVPLEPEDFEARSWIPHSGWPIGYGDVEDYYRKSYELLGLGDFNTTPQDIAAELGLPLIHWNSSLVKTQMSRYNRVRFGLAYGEDIAAAENIRVILYADASEFALKTPESRMVSSLNVTSPSKTLFRVRARHYILAGGGIENARLLLLSNRYRPAGLGNDGDAVGRYFAEHIWYRSGYLAPFDPRNVLRLYSQEVPYRDIAVRCHLVLSAKASESAQIGRFRTEIRPKAQLNDSMRALSTGTFSSEDLFRVSGSPFQVGRALACRGQSPRDHLNFENYVEQVPNPDSRVVLGPERDTYGRPQAQLDWHLSAMDYETVVRAHKLIATEAGTTNFGRMRIEAEQDPESFFLRSGGGAHHTGTTRMSATPRTGVVDANCRVHGTDNLFVAGSSVFPTAGYANPTLTIVALALRLSDHVKMLDKEAGLR